MKKTLTVDECPQCLSTKILGPRVVRVDEDPWCNCYGCGREWQVETPVPEGGE